MLIGSDMAAQGANVLFPPIAGFRESEEHPQTIIFLGSDKGHYLIR